MGERSNIIEHLESIQDVLIAGMDRQSARWIGDAIAMLRRQDPVKPTFTVRETISGKRIPTYYCGACGKELYANNKFCAGCGREVDWSE